MNIWDIEDLLGLKKTNRGWEGVYTTGQFDTLYDYDAGLLDVRIRSTTADVKDRYTVLLSISTIDDGVWQAFDPSDYTKEEADQRAEEVAQTFIKHMNGSLKLPTEAKLNKWLMPLKLWGEYTG